MTLKQLRERVQPGTKLVLLNCLLGPCRKARTVETVNTVGFAATGDGHVEILAQLAEILLDPERAQALREAEHPDTVLRMLTPTEHHEGES